MRAMLTLLGFTLPLCLDVFALSFGVFGEMHLTLAQRIRITVLFMAFEIGMPLYAYYLPLHDIFTAIVIQAFLAITVGQFPGWKVRTGSLRLNVDRIAAASKLTAGGALVALAAIVLLTPEITTHVIPHIYHYRYIPPLPHPTVSASK